MKKEFPARLHAVFASEKPLAVVFRRGPSKQVCTFLWDRNKDTFKLGQWLKGRIYERRSDLSPDGKYLLYFAMNGKWNSQTRGAWTAVSKAPYLKAIALYAKGDCWEGGGLFLSKNNFWLNDRYFTPKKILRQSEEVKRDEFYIPESGYGGSANGLRFNAEDTGVYYRRLLREGWQFRGSTRTQTSHSGIRSDERVIVFEKNLPNSWTLQKKAHEGLATEGKGCYWDEHLLIDRSSGEEIVHPDWEWAELDRKEIVWASQGCIYRAKVHKTKIGKSKLLQDFNTAKFQAIRAPY